MYTYACTFLYTYTCKEWKILIFKGIWFWTFEFSAYICTSMCLACGVRNLTNWEIFDHLMYDSLLAVIVWQFFFFLMERGRLPCTSLHKNSGSFPRNARVRNIAMGVWQTDGRTDRQTEDGQSDPYVSLCFAGDTKTRHVFCETQMTLAAPKSTYGKNVLCFDPIPPSGACDVSEVWGTHRWTYSTSLVRGTENWVGTFRDWRKRQYPFTR